MSKFSNVGTIIIIQCNETSLEMHIMRGKSCVLWSKVPIIMTGGHGATSQQ